MTLTENSDFAYVFQKKQKNLFGLKKYITFAIVKHMLKAQWAEGWAYTYILKGVTVRFGFDALRTSQIPNEMSKTKQRERPLGCF